jgi:hypothetical protein
MLYRDFGMRPTLEPKHYFSECYAKLYVVPTSNSIYVGMRSESLFQCMWKTVRKTNWKVKQNREISLVICDRTSLCILTSCIHTTMPGFHTGLNMTVWVLKMWSHYRYNSVCTDGNSLPSLKEHCLAVGLKIPYFKEHDTYLHPSICI